MGLSPGFDVVFAKERFGMIFLFVCGDSNAPADKKRILRLLSTLSRFSGEAGTFRWMRKPFTAQREE